VPVPKGRVALTPGEARQVAEELGRPVVVKAQVHAGGRGKGGGIKTAQSPEEAEAAAEQILGMRLVTPQTGAEGKLVRRVLVEEQTAVERELYLSVLVDTASGWPTMIASANACGTRLWTMVRTRRLHSVDSLVVRRSGERSRSDRRRARLRKRSGRLPPNPGEFRAAEGSTRALPSTFHPPDRHHAALSCRRSESPHARRQARTFAPSRAVVRM